MDELKKAWTALKDQSGSFTNISEAEIQKTIQTDSLGVVSKLRQQVRRKLWYCIFFTVLIAAGIPFVVPLASQILLTILLAAYLVGCVLLYQEHNFLKSGIDMSQDLLHGLKSYRDRVKRVLYYEELIGLCLYPVSAAGGFFIGMQAGRADAEIMNQTSDWIALVIALIALTIGGHWLARWMNKKAFGSYLDDLNAHIRELEEGESG